METTTAREIIVRAKKDDIHDGPVPEDDATAIEIAQEIVDMAEEAWNTHVRGPEVEAILKLAAGNQNGDESEPQEDEENPVEEPSAPESDANDDEPESPPAPFKDLDSDLSKLEPWEGYSDDTVANITEGINVFFSDMVNSAPASELEEGVSEFLSVLKNVWAFESSHKNRKRILNHIIEAWKISGGEIEAGTEDEEASDGDEPESVEEEATSTDDDDGSAESEPDASDDAGNEVGETSDEAGSGESETETVEEDQGKRSGGGREGSAEQKVIDRIESELSRERADGIPDPPQHELPQLPWSWNEVSDSQLQDYLMQYSAWAFYKNYQRTKHERVSTHAKQAADELTHAKRLEISHYDDKGKEKKVGLIDAEIAQDPSIKRWRRLQFKHDRMSISARQELDELHEMYESLSRLETMRHNAWQRARK